MMGDAEKRGADSRKKGRGKKSRNQSKQETQTSVGLNLQPPRVTQLIIITRREGEDEGQSQPSFQRPKAALSNRRL